MEANGCQVRYRVVRLHRATGVELESSMPLTAAGPCENIARCLALLFPDSCWVVETFTTQLHGRPPLQYPPSNPLSQAPAEGQPQ